MVAAETLGFESYAPAYLSPDASGKNLLIGANFASAGSGYYDHTALLYVSITNNLEKEKRSSELKYFSCVLIHSYILHACLINYELYHCYFSDVGVPANPCGGVNDLLTNLDKTV